MYQKNRGKHKKVVAIHIGYSKFCSHLIHIENFDIFCFLTLEKKSSHTIETFKIPYET